MPPFFRRCHWITFLVAIASLRAAAPGPADALGEARTLAEAAPEAERDELRQEVATTLARRSATQAALGLASQLPAARRAMVMIEVALHLPGADRREAEQLILDAQTAKSLTNDWRKARLARMLARAHAHLGHFEAAEALAHTVPDTEDRAFALQEIVAELCRAGLIEKARQLAGMIEENRRYGTYRQKVAALAETARTLHHRGNPEDAATLLAQAELLLPKKPGWNEGGSFVALAEARRACGETAKARELLMHAESLARTIAGSWRVPELARVAAAWRATGDTERARSALSEAAAFLATLPPLERAEESLSLARGWAANGDAAHGREVLLATLAAAGHAENQDSWRKPRVRALLVWTELFGNADDGK